MDRMPRIAEIHCTPMRFKPGDRILVRVYHPLDPEQLKRLRRGVERWAGGDVEVLIINTTQMDITVERAVPNAIS